MHKILLLNLFCILAIPAFVTAQEFQYSRIINPFHVVEASGDTFDYPFAGGFNTPVIQFIDINGDSNQDLFIQDRANQLIYYESFGSDFSWQTDYFENLEIGSWFKFADIDGDNDFDLFTEYRNTYIRYYINAGSAQVPLFIAGADTLSDNNGIPISLNGFSIPEWSDIDNDNELELFFGLQDGHIAFYEFSGLDMKQVPVFTFVSDTFESVQIVTGGGEIKFDIKHGANSMSFADIDNDNDFDLFWGDFFASGIIFIENTGDSIIPNLNQDDIVYSFPPIDPLLSGGFNVPRFADIDSDSDLDMFVGIIGGSVSTLTDREENFYYYENTGTPALYNFEMQTKKFISGIDFGQSTIPEFIDIDGDNDLDMFVANQEDLDSPNVDNSRLYFYENTGNENSPSFQQADSNYLNYDKRFDTNYSPVFVDIDNDNDYDLFLGKWDGRLTYYQNDGSVFSPNFVLISEYYSNIDVGNNSAPSFIDIDNDNDFDLFVGEFSGNINFYKNTGNSSNPIFLLDTSGYFGIDVGEYSTPFFVDIDSDNDFDLFCGSDTNGVIFYRNTGNATAANYILDYSFQIPLSLKTSPKFCDIDNDGDVDMFSGTAGGGIIYYENLKINSVDPISTVQFPEKFQLFQNFPNPFNPRTNIQFSIPNSEYITLKIYNLLGQEVATLVSDKLTPGSYKYTWDAEMLASGVYLYRIAVYSDNLQIENRYSQTKKMIYLK